MERKSIQKIRKALENLNAEEFETIRGYLKHVVEHAEMHSEFEVGEFLTDDALFEDLPPSLVKLARQMFETAAKAGNAEAMNELGALYYDGAKSFPQDYGKAREWFEKASEAGNEQATESLGYCLYYGRTGEPDYEKAFRCFAEGAILGRTNSLYKTGDMYMDGLFVEKNEDKAFRIYVRCLETMTEEEEDVVAGPVHLRLGKAYLRGTGTTENAFKALIHLQKAEGYLFLMVAAGFERYRKSYKEAVALQDEARRKTAWMIRN